MMLIRYCGSFILLLGLIVLTMGGCDSGDDDDDQAPPNPNPMTWERPPSAIDEDSIEMTATTAADDQWGVEYYFACTSHEGIDSGWQPVSYHWIGNLAPGTQYTFKVKARDTSGAGNETGWSEEASATTDPSPWRDAPFHQYTHMPPAGTDRILVVLCHGVNKTNPDTASPVDFTEVSYGGRPLTQIVEHHQSQDDQFSATAEIWFLNEADIQVAEAGGDLAIAFAAASEAITAEDTTEGLGVSVSSIFYQNVDQASPFGDVFTNGENENGIQMLTLPVSESVLADGGLVVANSTVRSDGSGAGNVLWTWHNGFEELGEFGYANEFNLAYSVAVMAAGAFTEQGAVGLEANGVAALAACVLNSTPGTQIEPIE